MDNELVLSDCKSFLNVTMTNDLNFDNLKSIANEAHYLSKTKDVKQLLISSDKWLHESIHLDFLLSIAESLLRLKGNDWKIAVVTSEISNQNIVLEDMLSLKDIELLHFTESSKAVNWLAQNSY